MEDDELDFAVNSAAFSVVNDLTFILSKTTLDTPSGKKLREHLEETIKYIDQFFFKEGDNYVSSKLDY